MRHPRVENSVERITAWVGSIQSLFFHSVVFIAFFALSFAGFLSWDLMFLILTTLVSLEAIYLAIFIQMTVNRHSQELEVVSEDMEGIHDEIEEISDDVDEIQEDIEDITEEDAERALEEQRKREHMVTLERLSGDVQRLLNDLEVLKKEEKAGP